MKKLWTGKHTLSLNAIFCPKLQNFRAKNSKIQNINLLIFWTFFADLEYCVTIYFLSRKYRVSKIGPFATNIGFLMMECEEAGPKVMTFLQERPVQLPKCEDLACDWKTFKDIYAVRK